VPSPPQSSELSETVGLVVRWILSALPLAICVGWWFVAPPSTRWGVGVLGGMTVLGASLLAWTIGGQAISRRLKTALTVGGVAAGMVLAYIAAPIAGVGSPGGSPSNPQESAESSANSSRSSEGPLLITVGEGAQNSFTYVLPMHPTEIPSPPNATNGCGTRERHDWATAIGGLPAVQDVNVSLEATREDVHVLITDLRVMARRLPARYITRFAPCPEDITIGGRPEGRFVYVQVTDSPKIGITDDQGRELKRLELSLKKGDEGAELAFEAAVDKPGAGYEWVAEISAVVDGVSHDYRIPNTGSFRVAKTVNHDLVWSDLRNPRWCRAAAPGCWAN
jgi:hypothetical protein